MKETTTQKANADTAGRANNDLLACPFCGGEAAHNTMRTSDKETIRLNGQDEFYGVNCIKCGTNNRGFIGHRTSDDALNTGIPGHANTGIYTPRKVLINKSRIQQ